MIKRNQIKKIEKYCKANLIDAAIIEEDSIEIDNKVYKIVSNEITLFDEEFDFLPASISHKDFVSLEGAEGWFYEFGGRHFILLENYEEFKFIEAKYIGKSIQKLPTESFLGIRSGYEILNGIGLYEDWVKKAKFLGVKNLGICEKRTLSGVLAFQKECKKANIKPIFGMTVPIIKKDDQQYEVKIYIKNRRGWDNALKMSHEFNVDQALYMKEEFFLDHLDGLTKVIDPKSSNFDDVTHLQNLEDIYYQLDPVEFCNSDKDEAFLNNLEEFIKSNIAPISITDAFCLEEDDVFIRESLWNIARAFDYRTTNQYFKSKDQYARELISLFEEKNKSWIKLFKEAVNNEVTVANDCNYSYDVGTRRLPKYEMSGEEKLKYDSNEELFLDLIKQGFQKKKIKDIPKYLKRIKREIAVLKRGDVIDYFLVLHDIIKNARDSGILTGIGRGSAGGSLISYFLEIIHIDPIHFDLLFERFLNEGRMGTMQECDLYVINTDKGEVKLIEGSMLRVERDKEELVIYVEELQEKDRIIIY